MREEPSQVEILAGSQLGPRIELESDCQLKRRLQPSPESAGVMPTHEGDARKFIENQLSRTRCREPVTRTMRRRMRGRD